MTSPLKQKKTLAKPIIKKKNRAKNNVQKNPIKAKVSQEQNALGNRAIEQQALESKAKDNKEEGLKSPTSPAEDKAFQSVLQHIKRSGKTQKKSENIVKKESEIKNASVLEVSEQQKNQNQKAHQSSIEDKSDEVNPEKHAFTSKSFKEKFEKQLELFKNNLPTSKKEAKNFKNKGHLENLEKGIKDDTTTSIESVSNPLTEVVSKEKNEKNNNIVPPQSIPEIVLGSTPKPIDKKAAIPKVKYSNEISMEKESKSLDETMKENDLTEEQLKNSNEPEFMETLDLKNEAQTKADDVPNLYRTEESKTLSLAEKQSGILGKQSFEKMVTSRSDNFGEVHKTQTNAQKENVDKKRLINGLFEVIYNGAKIAVSNRLNKITTDTDAFFKKDGKVSKAQSTFSENVKDRLEGIYGALDETITFFSRIGGGKSTAEKAKDIFDDEKEQFVATLNSAFDDIADLIVKGLNDAISYIDIARNMTEVIYKNLKPDEQKLLADSVANMQARYISLQDTVSDKEKELAQGLAKKYKENVDSLQETFDKIEEDVSASFLEKAYDATIGVAKTILKLKNLILDLFSEIKPFIGTIIKSPVSFVKKLFRGIGAGIELFKENIEKHVFGGFVKWLTGAMGSAGIKIPNDLFSLSGIFSLVMQVLGLGWDYIRKKAIKLLGEPMVKTMEKSVEIFQILRTQGIKGLWTYIKEQFNDLKKTIIDEIQNMLITQVLIAGVKWIVSLLIPGSGFVKAIMAIKDLIVFFVESAMMLIPSLISAIKALASGSIKGVAKAVENGLSSLIVLVISLFAKLIGLGGLSKKVIKIIERVRKRIDTAVDKLILKAKKAFKGLVKKGKGKKKKDKDKDKKGKIDKTLGKVLKFSAGGEKHRLWIENKGGKIKVNVASKDPGPIEKRLKKWEGQLSTLDKDNKAKAEAAIAKAKPLVNKTMSEAKEEAIITKAILKDKDITPAEVKKESKAEKETIAQEKKLKIYLMKLFEIFGYEPEDLLVIYEKEIDTIASSALKDAIKEKPDKWKSFKKSRSDGYNKEKFIEYRKRNGSINKTLSSLMSKYHKDKKDSPLFDNLKNKFLESFSKKSKPTHDNFNPNAMKFVEKDGVYKISYDNKTADGSKDSRFEIDIAFGEITKDLPDANEKRTVTGKSLINKPPKIGRGKWDSAKHGFDNAHLVGDQFGGAGKNYALNILPSSPNYNRIEMANIENKLASFINSNFEKGLKSYSLTVVAFLSHDKKNPSKLKKILADEFNKDNKNKNDFTREVKSKFIIKLQKEVKIDLEKLPAKFEKVKYESISIPNIQKQAICKNKDPKKEKECRKNTKTSLTSKGFVITLGKDKDFEELKKNFT